MISGAPGFGKTKALQHHQQENSETAVRVLIAKGEGNPFHAATSMPCLFCLGQTSGTDLTLIRVAAIFAATIGGSRPELVGRGPVRWATNPADCVGVSGGD